MKTLIDGSIKELNLARRPLLQRLNMLADKLIHRSSNLDQHNINTEKLNIKPIQRSDKNIYYSLFCNAHVTEHTGGVLSNQKIKENFNNSLKALTQCPIQNFTWVVQTKWNHRSIDILSLNWHESQITFAEFDVMFNFDYQNKGYCSELLEKFINYCSERYKLTSLYSYTLVKNYATQHILKKLSFIETLSIPFNKYHLGGIYWLLLLPDKIHRSLR